MSAAKAGGADPRAEAMCAVLARNWWLVGLRGVAAVVFGLIALVMPGAAMLTLAWLFGAYLLVDGVFTIGSAVRAARAELRWAWLLAEGVVDIVMGLIALAFPGAAVLGFVLVTAAWALLSGGTEIAAAFRLKESHGRWWLLLGGIASVAFGVLLILAPLMGAVVLTWWLGAYAVVFGVMLLVLAFRLRGQHTQAAPMGGLPGAA